MRILIAIPTFENIQPEVFQAVYDMDKLEHRVDFTFVRGYDCAKARSSIAEKAVEGGYDYVLMIDSDTVVPVDALGFLLEEPGDILLGCCPRKNTTKGLTALYPLSENPFGFKKPMTYGSLENGRVELRGGGFACAFIRTKVFSKLEKPYFKYVVYENGEALSEDLYFCLSARKAGFHIWSEPRVRCGHLSRRYQYE